MKTLNITAYTVTIDPESEGKISAEVTVSDSEYLSLLRVYDAKEIVRAAGTERLLDAMDLDKVTAYLESRGIRL